MNSQTDNNCQKQSDKKQKKIVRKAAIDNGTLGIAPNGQPSYLSVNKWLEARTANFKERFGGDWELAGKIDQIDNLVPIIIETNVLTENQALKAYLALHNEKNKQDGRIIRFVKNTFGKIVRHKGVDTKQIIPLLDKLFADSVPLYSEYPTPMTGHKEHSNFEMYHNYLNKINLNGKDYFVRLTVQQLKTRTKNFIPNELHNTFISEIQSVNPVSRPDPQHRLQAEQKLTDRITNASGSPVNSQDINRATDKRNSIADAKLLTFLQSARKYKEKFSTRLDINGEPYSNDQAFEINETEKQKEKEDPGRLISL
jgi:hypothetical protein